MTEKEKAKAYDEAIERAKKWHNMPNPIYCNIITEKIFPELKESEDEEIRKEIISILRNAYWTSNRNKFNELVAWLEKQGDKDKLIQELGEYKVKYTQEVLEKYITSMSNKDDERLRKTTIAFLKDFAEQGYENAVECIAWLEKQGEQKPTLPKWKYKKDNAPLLRDSIILNKYGGVAKSPSGAIVSDAWVLDYDELAKLPKEEKIEPKFKVGDWIITPKNKVLQITSIRGTSYRFNNESHYWEICYCDEQCHLWNIEDAKDGDVLACNEEILLFKSYSALQGRISLYCWYNGQTNNFHSKEVIDISLTTRNKVCPATKEQRDALMKAIKDAGYEWDIEKKELKKKVK